MADCSTTEIQKKLVKKLGGTLMDLQNVLHFYIVSSLTVLNKFPQW